LYRSSLSPPVRSPERLTTKGALCRSAANASGDQIPVKAVVSSQHKLLIPGSTTDVASRECRFRAAPGLLQTLEGVAVIQAPTFLGVDQWPASRREPVGHFFDTVVRRWRAEKRGVRQAGGGVGKSRDLAGSVDTQRLAEGAGRRSEIDEHAAVGIPREGVPL